MKIEHIYHSSPTQLGFLISAYGQKKNKLHVEQMYVEIQGKLSNSDLEKAFSILIEKHSVLRTGFSWEGAKMPLQIVFEEAPLDIYFEDWTTKDIEEQKTLLNELCKQELDKEFNYRKPPLLKIAFVKLSETRHYLVWTHHHAILDGWSQAQLLQQLIQIINKVKNNKPVTLEIESNYGKFVEWFSKQNKEQAKTFWKSKKEELQSVSLPDFIADSNTSQLYFVNRMHGGKQLYKKIKQFESQHGITFSTIMNAIWTLVLSKSFNKSKIVLGVANSGRPPEYSEALNSVGPFATTIPVCIDINSSSTMIDWLQYVQLQLAEVYEHGFYALNQIYKWADIEFKKEFLSSAIAVTNYPKAYDQDRAKNKVTPLNGMKATTGSSNYMFTLVVENDENFDIRLVSNRQKISDSISSEMLKDFLVTINIAMTNANKHVAIALDHVTHKFSASKRKISSVHKNSPKTDIQRQISMVFEQILGLKNIDVDSSFLDLGGHSLLVLKLLDNLNSKIGVQLKLIDVLEAPTVRMLADLVELKGANSTPAKSKVSSFKANVADMYKDFALSELQTAYLLGRNNLYNSGGVDSKLYVEINIWDADFDNIENIINNLIIAHPMLRAVMVDNYNQRILKTTPKYKLPYVDIQTNKNQESYLKSAREDMLYKQIDPFTWPLFDFKFFKLTKNKSRLFLAIDILIGDANSWRILMADFVAYYNNTKYQHEKIQLTYRDYILYKEHLKASERYQNAKQYWLNRIDTIYPYPKIPVNEGYSEHKNIFTRKKFILKEVQWNLLKELASQLKITPTSLLLSIYSEVLSYYSDSDKFTLNLTLSQRPSEIDGFDKVIGDFTSLTLLTVNQEAKTFGERTKAIQKQLWEDIEHRWFDGVTVIQELRKKLQVYDAPIMPYVFTSTLELGNYFEDWTSPFRADIEYSIGQTPQVYLDYQTFEVNGDLIVVWDYIDSFFPEGLIEAMFNDQIQIFDALIKDNDLIQSNTLFNNEVLIQNTSTDKNPDCLHTPFLIQVKNKPNQVAIISGTYQITYLELQKRAFHLSAFIKKVSKKSKGNIAIVLEQSWENVVAVLGVSLSGHAWVPIDPDWPEERCHAIITSTASSIIITNTLLKQRKWQKNTKVYPIEEEFDNYEMPTDVVQDIDPKSVAYIIHTSGSTGKPKGVIISHEAALNTILDINDRISLEADDKVFAISSASFDLSIYDIFGPLSAGGTIVTIAKAKSKDPKEWLDIIKNEGVTVWNSVPLLMHLFVDQPSFDWTNFTSLRVCLMSGDWIPLHLVKKLLEFSKIRVISLGGATECSIWSIAYDVTSFNPNWTSIPYGKALKNQHVTIRNQSLQIKPVWAKGEIYIGGLGVSNGYYNKAELTNLSFVKDPIDGKIIYRTGDWGRLLPDGCIEFMGREDSQVKINGFRVEIKEVELTISSLESIKDVVVLSTEGRENRTLIAFVISELTISGIFRELKQKLPSYLMPSQIISVDHFPLNSNGKLDRKALLTIEQKNTDTFHDTDGIIHIYEELFNRVIPDINTDLFSLGLTSIEMIRVFNSIEDRLGWRPEMPTFLKKPTLRTLIDMGNDLQPNKPVIVSNDAPKTIWKQIKMLTTPEKKSSFKDVVRHTLGGNLKHKEPFLPLNTKDYADYAKSRRSYRQFSKTPIDLYQFSSFLRCLEHVSIDNERRALYPSAGGLYAVSIWIHIKKDSVLGLRAGLYQYSPYYHNLVPVVKDIELTTDLHLGPSNREMAANSAFTIFLLINPEDIAPVYGESAEQLALLDAGYLGQLLSSTAIENGLGLCAIGQIDFEKIRWLFPQSNLVYLHALMGGKIDHLSKNMTNRIRKKL
tara:strand:+ start:46750 stop:52233 length:5484 start_codon:yes stop_codon:yes gene_type:complete